MRLEYKNHMVERGRLIILFEKITWFGLVRKEVEYIDSQEVYTLFGKDVWYEYPSFKRVSVHDNAGEVCDATKKYLLQAGKIQHKKN